jgi:hypothetical protein
MALAQRRRQRIAFRRRVYWEHHPIVYAADVAEAARAGRMHAWVGSRTPAARPITKEYRPITNEYIFIR